MELKRFFISTALIVIVCFAIYTDASQNDDYIRICEDLKTSLCSRFKWSWEKNNCLQESYRICLRKIEYKVSSDNGSRNFNPITASLCNKTENIKICYEGECKHILVTFPTQC